MPKPKQNKQFQTLLFAAFAAAGVLILYFASAAMKLPSLPLSTIEGKLELLHSDDFENEKAEYFHHLVTDSGKKYKLDFGNESGPLYLTGSKIKVTGNVSALTTVLTVKEIHDPQTGPASAKISLKAADFRLLEEAQPHNSPRKVVVILYRCPNSYYNFGPSDRETLRSKIYDTSDDYYREVSYGDRSIIGKNSEDGSSDIFGPYDLSDSSCNSSSARTAALNAGVDLTGYNHYAYVSPSNDCNCASLGGGWIQLGSTKGSTFEHEIGHNFGLLHFNGLSCTDSNGYRVTMGSSCIADEYAGGPGAMGGISGYGDKSAHFIAYGKGRLLWLQQSNTQTVSSNGEYTIKPLEQPGTGVFALRIPVGTFNFSLPCEGSGGGCGGGNAPGFYYLEYRQPIGLDAAPLSGDFINFIRGVTVNLASEYSSNVAPLLLDMTPGSVTAAAVDFKDAPLLPGRCFTDPIRKITIETLSVSTSEAKVRIELNSSRVCDNVSPRQPTNLQGAAVGPSRIDLGWTASTDNVAVTGYEIYRGLDPNNMSLVGTTFSPSYSDTGLSEFTSYYYYVTAKDGAGNFSAASTPTLMVKTWDVTPPTFAIGAPKADFLYLGAPEANLPNQCPVESPFSNNGKPLFRRAGLVRVVNPVSDASGVDRIEVFFDGILLTTFRTFPSNNFCFSVPAAVRSNVPLTFKAYDKASPQNVATKTILVDVLP